LEWLKQQQHCYETFNIARDDVISIAELLHEAEEVTDTKIQVLNVAHHLNQDVLDQIGADVTKAKQVLAWTAQRTVAQMLQDQWRFYRGA
jgi:UDP-glucose 4-epimerase